MVRIYAHFVENNLCSAARVVIQSFHATPQGPQQSDCAIAVFICPIHPCTHSAKQEIGNIFVYIP